MKTIFISSTFQDMNEERDLFHNRICPELNEIAGNYGESVSVCDLRWGVDTSSLETDEGSRKVLSVCLDEIDRCRPYMIILLGDRYGWIPDKEMIAKAVENRWDFPLKEMDKSITALEIEYGALHYKDFQERTLIYFREIEGNPPVEYQAEGSYHAQKLQYLKERILNVTQGRIKTYKVNWDEENNCLTGLDKFADMVISDVRNLMERDWHTISKLNPHQRDSYEQWNYAQQKAGQFAVRDELIEKYIKNLNEDVRCWSLQGPTGIGKSTIMSRLAFELKSQGKEVLPIFCGRTTLCNSAINVLQYMINYLETLLEQPGFVDGKNRNQMGLESYQNRLTELIEIYNKSDLKTLVILIDAVDQLAADAERDSLCFITMDYFHKVKIMISCSDEFAIRSEIQIEKVPPLAKIDREGIVRGILKPMGKSLSEEVVESMVEKEGSDNPLYLSLLVTRLEMMDRKDFEAIRCHGGGIDEINKHQVLIVDQCPTSLEQLCVEILKEAVNKLNSELPMIASRFMAVAQRGLRESDLEGIFEQLEIPWDALTFSQFRKYMNRFFIQREDGRWDFSHGAFRRGLHNSINDSKFYHKVILKHFQMLEKNDEVKIKEITYHCILADDKDYFCKYLWENGRRRIVRTEAADTTAMLAIQDSGKWLLELLNSEEAECWRHTLIDFVSQQLPSAFIDSTEMLNLKKQILEENLFFAKKYAMKDDDISVRHILSCSYEALGNVYFQLKNQDDLKRAYQLYEESMLLREKISEEADTSWSKYDLSVSCSKMGDVLMALKENNYVENALMYYEKDLLINEALFQKGMDGRKIQRSLFVGWSKLGDIYLSIGDVESIQKAQQMYEKSLEYCQAYDEQVRNLASRQDLAACYDKLGQSYSKSGVRSSLDMAMAWYEKSLAECKAVHTELHTTRSGFELGRAYYNVGHLCLARNAGIDIEWSVVMFKNAKPYIEEAVKFFGTMDAKQALIDVYVGLSESFQRLGSNEQLNASFELLVLAMNCCRGMVDEFGSADSKRNLAVVCNRLGDLLIEMGGTDNVNMAFSVYEEFLQITKELVKADDSPLCRWELSIAYERIGILYNDFGGSEGRKKAIELFDKCLVLREREAEELGTDAEQDGLGVLLFNIAKHPDTLPQTRKEHLKRALGIFQKLVVKTGSDRHKALVKACTKMLDNMINNLEETI